jgi:hypothetical protein
MSASFTHLPLFQPDCGTYPCRDDCCSEGCDVWPAERDALLSSGLAQPSDFDEGYEDDEGDFHFRTSLGSRGCTFLESTRGCRLHTTGLKPAVCSAVPRDAREADEMYADHMLPCRSEWRAFP